ncbi:MAG: hypothetical protein LBE02_01475 [Spirochaetaceae bacterium]|jgi:hypothetical protein|nr:hypothetical protein [Spirochaetaceae bacterium]
MKHPVRSGFAAGSALFCGPLIFLVPGFFLLACISEEDRALQDPPIISSASYQHTLYTGSPQPIEARAAKDDVAPLLITYFPSEQALLRNEGGSRAPPSEVGDYYVRIERPGGNGYKRGRDIKVEYHIQKAFVAIVADPVQRFVYDGAPKEPVVRSEPPVELHILYTPVPAAGDATEDPPVLNFPPSGRGVYRVTIVFSGNERYMGASRDIELRIE